MRLKEIMTQHVECLNSGDTLVHAAKRMRDLNVGSLPVCGKDDRLAGILTDRDLTVRGTATACDPETTLVTDVMTPEISCCFEDDDVTEGLAVMEEKQIRRIAVLDRDERLVGIVSLGDFAVKCGDSEVWAEALEQISEPVAAR